MRKTLKDVLAVRPYAVNGYCSLPGAFTAELFGRQGWDSVTLDLQHGLISYDSALAILQALTSVDVVPMARLSWLEPGPIMKLLDAGVLGITCPMICNAEQAERLVRYCKYPPRGERSLGPLRAGMINGDDYVREANSGVSVFPMIETAEGLNAVDEILSVDGIDGIYIGPGDLAVSLGEEPQPAKHAPRVQQAIDHIIDRCRSYNRVAGIFAPDVATASEMIRRGCRLITLSSDARILARQADVLVSALRDREPVS